MEVFCVIRKRHGFHVYFPHSVDAPGRTVFMTINCLAWLHYTGPCGLVATHCSSCYGIVTVVGLREQP